jgi:hypothetical protein
MRENRTYGSEGGEGYNPSRPLSASPQPLSAKPGYSVIPPSTKSVVPVT